MFLIMVINVIMKVIYAHERDYDHLLGKGHESDHVLDHGHERFNVFDHSHERDHGLNQFMNVI